MRAFLFVMLWWATQTFAADPAMSNESNVYIFSADTIGIVESLDGTDTPRGCAVTSAAVAVKWNTARANGNLRAMSANDCSLSSWPTEAGVGGTVQLWLYDVAAQMWQEDSFVVGVTLHELPSPVVFAPKLRDLTGLSLVVGWAIVWGLGFVGGQQR